MIERRRVGHSPDRFTCSPDIGFQIAWPPDACGCCPRCDLIVNYNGRGHRDAQPLERSGHRNLALHALNRIEARNRHAREGGQRVALSGEEIDLLMCWIEDIVATAREKLSNELIVRHRIGGEVRTAVHASHKSREPGKAEPARVADLDAAARSPERRNGLAGRQT